jgi:hypothetical protein
LKQISDAALAVYGGAMHGKRLNIVAL